MRGEIKGGLTLVAQTMCNLTLAAQIQCGLTLVAQTTYVLAPNLELERYPTLTLRHCNSGMGKF